VKAHAYGHGLPAAIRGFTGVDGLALLEFDNARRLRALGWRGPILMLEGPFGPEDVAMAGELGLSLVVHDATQIEWLRGHEGKTIDVWLKLNTGMNRLGLDPDSAASTQRELSVLPAVGTVSLLTHFSDADRPGGAAAQIERFDRHVRGRAEARPVERLFEARDDEAANALRLAEAHFGFGRMHIGIDKLGGQIEKKRHGRMAVARQEIGVRAAHGSGQQLVAQHRHGDGLRQRLCRVLAAQRKQGQLALAARLQVCSGQRGLQRGNLPGGGAQRGACSRFRSPCARTRSRRRRRSVRSA
jgi:hypothetical protein